MTNYNNIFLDLADISRKDEDLPNTGNNWHQRMGYQKPNNIDQSIKQIKASEYAPFTREPEQPSTAELYLQHMYGGVRRIQQDQQDYGAVDKNIGDDLVRTTTYRRSSSSPDRGGLRRPGPDWGNTHFGTKPRRRSVVEAETRAILDDNAPPLASFYDELIAEELHLKHLENIPPVNTQGQHNPNLVNGQLVPVPTHRPVLDQPKAVRVSNYSENRWQEVLRALAPFGTILERFEELRRIPYYEPIPTKVLAESDDDVAKQARFICTGDGWTKITFARRESAEEVIALSGSIQIGGRDLVIEPWNPSLHGRPAGIAYPARPAASAPLAPVPQEPTMFASSSDLFAGNGFTRRRAEQQQQQAMFTESFAISVPMTSAPVRVPRIPLSTPGGTELSTQMRGAKVIQLKQVEFKKQPGLVTQLMSWIWGEVGPAGGHLEDSGWVAWFVNLLFGRL